MKTRKNVNFLLLLNAFTLVMPLVASATPTNSTSSSSRLLPKSLNDEKAPRSAQDKVLYDEQFLLPIGEFLSLKDFINTQSFVNKAMCNVVLGRIDKSIGKAVLVPVPGSRHYYLKHRLSGKWVQAKRTFVPKSEGGVSLTAEEHKVLSMLNNVEATTALSSLPVEWMLNSDGSPSDSLLGLKMRFVPFVKIEMAASANIKFLDENKIKVITVASAPVDSSQSVEGAYDRLIQSFEVMTPDSLENPDSLPDPRAIEVLKTLLVDTTAALLSDELELLGVVNREQALDFQMDMFFRGVIKPQIVGLLKELKSEAMKNFVSSKQGAASQSHVSGKDEKNELRETQESQIVSETVFDVQLASDGNSFTLSKTPSILKDASAVVVALTPKILEKTTYERRKEKVSEKEELSGGPSNGKEEQKSEHRSVRGLDE